MAEVASAYVSLLPSARGFGKKLSKDVGSETQGAAKKLGSGFGKTFALAGGALAAVGIGSFLKDAIGGAGDLEQSVGAIDTVFGDSAKKMHAWSKAAALDVGLTRNEFNELGTLIGAQLKNGGTAMDELAPKTDKLIGLGADLSSMFGGNTKDAVEALSSALKGERDPIERYGVSLNQAKIDAEAAALGFQKVDGALSDEAKQAATLSLIMKQTKDAHGNFAKESDTYAGKIQRLGAQWGNIKTTIGSAVLPALTNVAGFLNDRVMPAIKRVADNIGPAFSEFKDAAGDIRDRLDFGPKLREIAELGWGKFQSGIAALKSLTEMDFSQIDGQQLGKQLGTAISDGLSALGGMAKNLTAKFGELFGKVDWVGIGITVGKQAPALLVGLAAGILNFDLGSLLSGIADHWGEILIGVLTLAFAPAKLIGPLAKILGKIPFVGPFIARGLVWFNDIGRAFGKRVASFMGDLGRMFTRGFGSLKIPGAGLVKSVMGAFKAVPGQVKEFFALLKTRLGVWALDAFEAMGRSARGAIGTLIKIVTFIPKQVVGAIGSLAKLLFPQGSSMIGGFGSGIKQAFVAVVKFHKDLPGRLIAAVGDLGSTLYGAGQRLISGLASGITSKMTDAINAVKAGLSKIKGLLPGSPIKWGPLKNWNNGGAGKRLMGLVEQGVKKATPKTVAAAQTAFTKISDSLKKTRDDLRGTLDGLKSDFASLAESISGAFTGNLFDVSAIEMDREAGIGAKSVSQVFRDNLLGKKAELSGLLSSFRTLQGWGLNPAFLSQLFASGNGALITELAGMGQTGALDTASLFNEVTGLGDQLGSAVAMNDPISDRIDETNRLLTEAVTALNYLGSDIGKELNGAAAEAQRKKKKKRGRK